MEQNKRMEQLFYACQYGNLDIVNQCILFYHDSWDHDIWNWCLYDACRSGYIDIVKRLIQVGSNNYNLGLYGACFGGYFNITNLMIKLGANDYNNGIQYACNGGHMYLAKFMISKGATNFEHRHLHNIRNIYNNSPEEFQDYKKKLQQYFLLNDFQEILLNLSSHGNLGKVTARGSGIISKVIEMNTY